jgi:phosphatidylglycerophosphate synthase
LRVNTRLSKPAAALASVLASALLLALTSWLVDWREVFAKLRGLSLGWTLLALLLQGVQVVIVATRWYWITRLLGSTMTFGRAVSEYTLSTSVNLLVPGGFAGDVLRGVRQSKAQDALGPVKVWIGVVSDRALGQVYLCLLASLSVGLWLPQELRPYTVWVVVVLALAVLVAAALPVVLGRRNRELGQELQRFVRRLAAPGFVAGQLGLAALLAAAWIASFCCASLALGFDTPVSTTAQVAIPTLLAASIPGFVNGWGPREGAAALAHRWVGLSATEGSAVSVTYGMVGWMLALLGLTLLLPKWRPSSDRWAGWSRVHSTLLLVALALAFGFGQPLVLTTVAGVSFAGLLWISRGSYSPVGFGAANAITAVRLLLVLGLSAIPGADLRWVGLTCGVVLALDVVDGIVARRAGSASTFGARFDMESDAFFVLCIGVHCVTGAGLGAWALIPGLWRYAYVVLLEFFPARYGEAPRSSWARYSFAVTSLLTVAALLSPHPIASVLMATVTLLVSYSFGRSLWYSYVRGARPDGNDQSRQSEPSKPVEETTP